MRLIELHITDEQIEQLRSLGFHPILKREISESAEDEAVSTFLVVGYDYLQTTQILEKLRGLCDLELTAKRLGSALSKAGFNKASKNIDGVGPRMVWSVGFRDEVEVPAGISKEERGVWDRFIDARKSKLEVNGISSLDYKNPFEFVKAIENNKL